MPFATINGKDLYYVQQSAEKPNGGRRITCLMIHGLGSSSSFYAPIIPGLTAFGVDCIAVDTEGSGLSKHHGSPQTTQSIAADMTALMTSIGLDSQSTVLVGHSMGGMIVCELASAKKYAAVVLLGPVHPAPAVSDVFTTRIKNVREDGLESMADTIPKAATGSASKPIHWAFIRTLLLAQDAEGYISLCRLIAEAQPPEYVKIECPILFLAGTDDKTSPMSNIIMIRDSCSSPQDKKTVISLDGVGHWHVIEAGDVVCSHMNDFIGKL